MSPRAQWLRQIARVNGVRDEVARRRKSIIAVLRKGPLIQIYSTIILSCRRAGHGGSVHCEALQLAMPSERRPRCLGRPWRCRPAPGAEGQLGRVRRGHKEPKSKVRRTAKPRGATNNRSRA